MIEYAALAAAVATVIWICAAAFTHFDLNEPSPLGATLLSIATPLGALLNFAVWRRGAPLDPWLAALALFLFATSAGLFGAAKRSAPSRLLSRAFSDRTPDLLVSSGIYAYIRNPLYTSYIVYWSGWVALTGGAWPSWVIFGGMLAAYVSAALGEERRLGDRMGEPYAAYRARTHRFVPWLI